MVAEELIETLDKKRESLEEIIERKDMNLNCREVLACSWELDDLITTYINIFEKNT